MTPHHTGFTIVTGGWCSGSVRFAAGRRARRRGLMPVPGPLGLLLRTRSIHSFGMRSSVGWVAFDAAGTVLAAGVLRPGRVVLIRRARFILEQAAHLGLPLPGERAIVLTAPTRSPVSSLRSPARSMPVGATGFPDVQTSRRPDALTTPRLRTDD